MLDHQQPQLCRQHDAADAQADKGARVASIDHVLHLRLQRCEEGRPESKGADPGAAEQQHGALCVKPLLADDRVDRQQCQVEAGEHAAHQELFRTRDRQSDTQTDAEGARGRVPTRQAGKLVRAVMRLNLRRLKLQRHWIDAHGADIEAQNVRQGEPLSL
eukprot:1197090-Pleurochrysis_carterae.AAC.3